MQRRISLNPLSCIFLPEIDRKNKFTTIIYNPDSERIIKVNNNGYKILKALDENPQVRFEKLLGLVSNRLKKQPWQIESEVSSFIKQMTKENVIQTT